MASLGLILRHAGETNLLCLVGRRCGCVGGGSEAARQTPESGGAQAGGASPPFTWPFAACCARSRFEVFGAREERGGGSGVEPILSIFSLLMVVVFYFRFVG